MKVRVWHVCRLDTLHLEILNIIKVLPLIFVMLQSWGLVRHEWAIWQLIHTSLLVFHQISGSSETRVGNCPSGVSPQSIWETINKGWDTAGTILCFRQNAPVVSHPVFLVSWMVWGVTPLGRFCVFDKMSQWCLTLCLLFLEWFELRHHWDDFVFSTKCPSGVSPFVYCFSNGETPVGICVSVAK